MNPATHRRACVGSTGDARAFDVPSLNLPGELAMPARRVFSGVSARRLAAREARGGVEITKGCGLLHVQKHGENGCTTIAGITTREAEKSRIFRGGW